MKRLLRSLTVAAAGVATFAVFAPTEASAQCRTSHDYGYGNGYRTSSRVYVAPRPARRYAAPRHTTTVRVVPRRVVRSSHYSGPIYYRNSSLYARPSARAYVPSRGYTHSRRRCR